MRFLAVTFLLAAVIALTGCRAATPWSKARKQSVSATPEKPIVTPANVLVGKIARVSQAGRFVVIVFPVGHLPALEQKMGVYRSGLKKGEVKITGPQLDDSVVADLTAGEAQPGDSVRQ